MTLWCCDDIKKANSVKMSDREKVRKLLKSIKAKHMATPVTTARAAPRFMTSFVDCTNHLQTHIVPLNHQARKAAQAKTEEGLLAESRMELGFFVGLRGVMQLKEAWTLSQITWCDWHRW